MRILFFPRVRLFDLALQLLLRQFTMLLVIPFITLLLLNVGDSKLLVTMQLSTSPILVQGAKSPQFSFLCFATGGAVSLDLYRIDHQGNRNKLVSTHRVPVYAFAVGSSKYALYCGIAVFQVGDAGVYECETKDSSSGTARVNTTIYVDVPPSINLISISSSVYVVSEGKPFSINCSANRTISPTPSVTLSHKGTTVNSTTGYEVVHLVTNAANSDEGNYTCFVGNRQGNVTKGLPSLIDVQPPAIIKYASNPRAISVVKIEDVEEQ
eukprot:m.268282 g.268282  ORF g.268282 m.268282 type:complete len:267 (+) comp40525_c1_seq11:420-1220(+)